MNTHENTIRDNIIGDLGTLLRARAWRLCVAESVTAGRLQALIGSVSGASDFFEGGITTYNLEQKVRHLGVDRDEATATNCVSPLACQQMSRGACSLFQADLAIATTGYAEPDPSHSVQTPFAYVSIWQAVTDTELAGLKLEGPPADPWLDGLRQRQFYQQYFAESALVTLLEKLRLG